MNPNMFAKVVLASRPTNGAPPIITMHWRYPRIIHGEVMTHRMFSRNARSSRAVPVKTMLNEVRNDPFVPWHWGKNQSGMQASEECDRLVETKTIPVEFDCDFITREEAWRAAADVASGVAEAYMNSGYHKQIANRLLEPFSYIDTLITSTSWANFLHLRDHEDAEPHFHDLAKLVREAIDGAEYQDLEPGQWHLPYANDDETGELALRCARLGSLAGGPDYANGPGGSLTETKKRISVARCARISYKPFDGDASISKELQRYELLVGSSPLHASPAEHQATPDRPLMKKDWATNGVTRIGWSDPELAGNLGPGWIQFRKTLPNEYIAD